MSKKQTVKAAKARLDRTDDIVVYTYGKSSSLRPKGSVISAAVNTKQY